MRWGKGEGKKRKRKNEENKKEMKTDKSDVYFRTEIKHSFQLVFLDMLSSFCIKKTCHVRGLKNTHWLLLMNLWNRYGVKRHFHYHYTIKNQN